MKIADRSRRGPFAVALLAALCLLAPALPRAARAPSALKPLEFTILEDYDKGERLDEVAKDFALFQELGITTWRGSFGWDDYEPRPGRYDLDWLHRFITLAARQGIALRPYVAYTPEWAAAARPDRDRQPWNQPPRDLAAWRSFIGALGRELRHHPNVRSLEIYNEENVAQWWEGTAAEYAAVLRSAARQRPAPTIVMGGLVFPDLPWTESVCGPGKAGAAFDVLAVHAYPETWTPEGVTVENYLGEAFARSFLPAVDRACGRKKVWIDETGYATVPGRSETDQAAWWVRAVATFAAEPRVEQIGVYEIKDLAPDRPAIGDAPNYHLGITRVDRRKKLAFSTIQALVALLGPGGVAVDDAGVQIRRDSAAGGEPHAHAFRLPDGAYAVFVWNRIAGERVRVHLPAGATRATEYTLDNSRRPLTIDDASEVTLALEAGIPRMFRVTTAGGAHEQAPPGSKAPVSTARGR